MGHVYLAKNDHRWITFISLKTINSDARRCRYEKYRYPHTKCTEVAMKKRAPRAVSEIKKYAMKAMATKDIRIDTKLNKSRAPRSVAGPSIRQQLERSYKNYLQKNVPRCDGELIIRVGFQ